MYNPLHARETASWTCMVNSITDYHFLPSGSPKYSTHSTSHRQNILSPSQRSQPRSPILPWYQIQSLGSLGMMQEIPHQIWGWFLLLWTLTNKKISYFSMLSKYAIVEHGQSNCIKHFPLERRRIESPWQTLIWYTTLLKSYQAEVVGTFYFRKGEWDGNVPGLDPDFASHQRSLKSITFLRDLWLCPICPTCGGHSLGICFPYVLSGFLPLLHAYQRKGTKGHFKSLTVSDIYNLGLYFLCTIFLIMF